MHVFINNTVLTGSGALRFMFTILQFFVFVPLLKHVDLPTTISLVWIFVLPVLLVSGNPFYPTHKKRLMC